MAAASASFSLLLSSIVSKPNNVCVNSNSRSLDFSLKASFPSRKCPSKSLRIVRDVSISSQELRTGGPMDLLAFIISKVTQTDGGVSLTKEEHKEVAEVPQELQKYCVEAPAKYPLIFGEEKGKKITWVKEEEEVAEG